MATLAEDRDAIRDLHARYCSYIDSGAAEEWAALYTEDGEFEADEGKSIVGREALKAFASSLSAGSVHRMVTNHVIDVSGDEATCTASVILISKRAIVQTCHTHDELRRVDGCWRIARRTYTPDSH